MPSIISNSALARVIANQTGESKKIERLVDVLRPFSLRVEKRLDFAVLIEFDVSGIVSEMDAFNWIYSTLSVLEQQYQKYTFIQQTDPVK